MAVGEVFVPVTENLLSGFGGWIGWLVGGLLLFAFLFGGAYLIKNYRSGKKKWNKTLRIWRENPQTGKIPLDPYTIKAAGTTINGVKFLYLKIALMGGRLMPLLNHYTKPGLYDLIITADNRFFLADGITGIDKLRKEIGIGIRYPGIDHQFDNINKKFAEMNKVSNFDRTLEILKKVSAILLPIILLIALIIGGNYAVKLYESEAIKSQAELEMMQIMKDASITYKESGDSMIIILDQIKDITGTRNLKSYVDRIKNEELNS